MDTDSTSKNIYVNTAQRKIIHIDADSFYASVEIRENPFLEGKPVAVGGRPGGRGVIATCNYEARKFGVHSAMPTAQAAKLCPELIFLRPNFPLYRDVSHQIRAILNRYTSIIEPLSLDEAYLDVTGVNLFQGSATRIAQAIKDDVQKELHLVVSAGVAPNKFLAKIASDWEKPDGLFVIKPSDVEGFVEKLPVQKINGVGQVTAKKLNSMGIQTCGDLKTFELAELCQRFGKYGNRLYDYARGVDNRKVQTERVRKSLSIEHTYSENIATDDELQIKGNDLFEDFVERCKKLDDDTVIAKRFVKIKFADFTQTTLEETIQSHEHHWLEKHAFIALLNRARERSTKPIRLLGMGVRLKHQPDSKDFVQLTLF